QHPGDAADRHTHVERLSRGASYLPPRFRDTWGEICMNVFTVSREYGAGGGEAARKLADALGCELLDRELLRQAAAVEQLPDAELERLDEQAGGRSGLRRNPLHEKYIHGLTEAARQAAARGNVVLVGRGTHQLLGEEEAFHLRMVAPRDWRVARMAKREGWTREQALAHCQEVDRTRDRFVRYFFGPDAARLAQYDLIVNTSRVRIDDVVSSIVQLFRDPGGGLESPGGGPRVLTLSRELGAGDTGFAPTLASRLGM